MAEITKRNKALSVNPLKASQPVGGALATLGFNRAMPMLHGSQGCTAFAKVFFVRHFREPIPLQTTAMDQASSVMGADENVIEGLKTICEKSRPDLITVLTTGLSETQGADIVRNIKEFRTANPEFDDVAIVPVTTPDYAGCVESGYALTVTEIIRHCVPDASTGSTKPGSAANKVNIIASSMLTPGDLEALHDILERFELEACFIPDISESLDGCLTDADFTPLTIGGCQISALKVAGNAIATIAIGASMKMAAELLEKKSGVTSHCFDHLYGLKANDRFISLLHQLSGKPVPARIERQRSQLQDAMLDTHFMLGLLKVGIAADPDQLIAFADLVRELGSEVTAAVASSDAPVLTRSDLDSIKIGDLEDMEQIARENGVELMIGNSHVAAAAERLGAPLLHAGFPLYDVVGGYQKTWVGYRGARQTLFDLANLVLNSPHHEIEAYRSIYAQKLPSEADQYPLETKTNGPDATHANRA